MYVDVICTIWAGKNSELQLQFFLQKQRDLSQNNTLCVYCACGHSSMWTCLCKCVSCWNDYVYIMHSRVPFNDCGLCRVICALQYKTRTYKITIHLKSVMHSTNRSVCMDKNGAQYLCLHSFQQLLMTDCCKCSVSPTDSMFLRSNT